MKQKYYVVWEGASEGVFTSWEACQEAVNGFPGAKYKSYKTLEEAEEAYYNGAAAPLPLPSTAPLPSPSLEEEGVYSNNPLKEVAPIATEANTHSNVTTPSPSGKGEGRGAVEGKGRGAAIAVDAACSGNPGPMEYRGVYLPTGQEIFHFGPVYGTNNIGEFLAIVHGLALLKQKNLPLMPIYSDSVNAQLWVRKRKCKTTLERNERTEELYKLIERAEHWLRTNTYSNPIIKWETDKWGEIPADFGRK